MSDIAHDDAASSAEAEAEADLVNFGRQSSLEEEFDALEADDEIEAELNKLKSSQSTKNDDTPDA